MIEFRRRTPWQRLLRLIPACRRRQDATLREVIERLVDDPLLPCVIEGRLVPDGYGGFGGDETTLAAIDDDAACGVCGRVDICPTCQQIDDDSKAELMGWDARSIRR